MGTQLSYGGSGTAPWDEAASDTAAVDQATGGASDPEEAPPVPTPEVDSLVDHIIQALENHERRPIPGASTSYTTSSVRPGRYVPGSPSLHSGTSRFVSTPRSGRSTRQSVARGAAAVSAGAALARGDRDALRELGLDLDDLAALSAREQQQKILDEVIGAPGHPDDEALRRAAHATLKELAADPTMTQDNQIDFLLGAYVYEQALVELSSNRSRFLSKDALRRLDDRLKPYIFRKARHQVTGASRYLSPALFIEKAAEISGIVLAAIRSHDTGGDNG